MCKTGFMIRDDEVRCKVCGADGTVTPLSERRDADGDLDYAICGICVETKMDDLIGLEGEDLPALTPVAIHINRAMNVAVEQISARMIEYLDSMGEPRG